MQTGEGDPSPENVRPITGWTGVNITRCGKNLLPITFENCKALNTSGVWDGNTYTFNNGTFTVLTDESGVVTGVMLNGTFESNSTFYLLSDFKVPANNYILTGCPAGGGVNTYRLRLPSGTSSNNDYGSGCAITVDDKNRSYQAQIYCKLGIAYDNILFTPMLRLSTDSETFEPRKGNTYPITFPASAGTVYGGTLDVVNKKLTVDKVLVDAGSIITGYTGDYFYGYVAAKAVGNKNIIASCYATSDASTVSNMLDFEIKGNIGNENVYIKDSRATSVSELNSLLTNQTILYELATPIVYDLTDIPEILTLYGTNNIWADCGDVTVTYGAYLDEIDESVKDADAKAELVLHTVKSEELAGSIVTFDSTVADMPLKGLTVDIEPVQAEGTPSPENPLPITGWTGCQLYHGGKNLIPSGIAVGKGYINASGDVVGSAGDAAYRHTADYIRVLPNASYTISGNVFGGATNIFYNTVAFYDANKVFLSRFLPASANTPAQFTTPSNCYYIRFNFPADGNIAEIQMEYGNTATAFDRQASIYPITFPTSAGTVYGGTLDVVSGVLTVDRAIVDVGDLTMAAFVADLHMATYAISNRAYGDRVTLDSYSNSYEFYGYSSADNLKDRLADGQYGFQISNRAIRIRDDRFSTEEDFVAAMAGVKIVYYLATPIVYNLTDIPEILTLYGTNNIWADCGDVTVTYGAYLETVKAHAERLGDSILSAIAPLEASYTASRAYAVGAFLFVGTTFYKVIAAIAEGGTITPGTNAVQTTVAEQLMELSFVILEQPHSKPAAVGETVYFSVIARGVADYKWFFRSIGGSDDSWDGTTVDGSRTSTIIIEATTQRYGYEYRCRLTGISGEVIYTDPVSIINPST